MIHALIVEDERTIRNGLMRYIQWESLGVNEVKTAASGEEAMALLDAGYMPELVLTDIRMSGMDGTRMAEQMRQRLPDMQIIFITGYTDKEYLQSAIVVGAAGYVEKPVDPEELSGLVRKAVEKIRKSQNTKNLTLHALLGTDGGVQGADPALFAHYFVFLMRAKSDEIPNFDTLADALAGQMTDASDGRIISVLYDHVTRHTYMFLISGLRDAAPGEVERAMAAILDFFLRAHEDCFVSCSRQGHRAEEIRDRYDEAALAQKNLAWKGWNTFATPDEENETLRIVIGDDRMSSFRSAVGNRQKEEAAAFVREWTQYLIGKKAILNIYTRNVYCDMDRVISHFGAKSGSWPAEFEEQNDIGRCQTFAELEDHVRTRLDYALGTGMGSPGNQQIDAVCRYIREHLKDPDLSTAMLAEVVGLSASYLSSLFSQTRNETIIQYITDCRIEKAKELLKDPRYRLYEVADMVGYEDPKYFSKQFKKVTGVTPREFRNSL